MHTIIPSIDTVFPEADWLIGNHSDELTVWIPVMAARSSYTCNFFLLPCCPYEFDGRKYCRTNTSVSQYSDFLSYVEKVCEECGIITEKDKLRIPSTKRLCFIGTKRTYSPNEWKAHVERLQSYVDSKCCFIKQEHDQTGESATLKFKPRGEERVRNCTQIQPDIRESIVRLVVEQLLAKRKSCEGSWTYGGDVEISTLAKIIPLDLLKKLKSECGGLQTLLKNHHYIFKVENGKVGFRVPSVKSKDNSTVWKKKSCWFYHNHPNSCPLSDDACSFIH